MNKKHIIKVESNSDGFIVVLLDGRHIDEDGWDLSYCEHCDELAYALEYIFNLIKGEPFDFIREEVEEFSE